MAGAFLELRKAIFAALNGDAGAGGLRDPAQPLGSVTGIFDTRAPQGSTFPYLTLGASIGGRFDTFALAGAGDLLTLHVWSRYAGSQEAWLIRDRVRTLLDRQVLSVAGWGVVDCQEEHVAGPDLDEDGVTLHLVCQYRLAVVPA